MDITSAVRTRLHNAATSMGDEVRCLQREMYVYIYCYGSCRRIATSTTIDGAVGAASARSPGITDRRPGEVRGRRDLVLLDRNTPMG